MAEPSLA